MDKIVLDGELSLNIPMDGEVRAVIEVGHNTGIDTIVFNPDYTLTFNMTNGETFTTGSIRGEQGAQGAKGDAGDDYVLTEQDKEDIAELVDAPVDDVQIDGTSIVNNGVAGIPFATLEQPGVGRIGADYGITMLSGKRFVISRATSAVIKSGNQNYRPIVSSNQHEAVFYGLAKASGDTTQSQSDNEVGQYTEDAKSAISDMLNGSVSVSGATPTIVAKSGIRYVCGEVASLDFTPCAIGICDVVFTSGTTPTVLTIPSTIKWANGFDPSSLDANTTYELNIMDGLGVAVGWT